MLRAVVVSTMTALALSLGIAAGLSPYAIYSHFAANFNSGTAAIMCFLGVPVGLAVVFVVLCTVAPRSPYKETQDAPNEPQ